MTNYAVHIARKSTINSHSPAGYSIRVDETADVTTNRLLSADTVDNNTIRVSGVFATERAAVLAILDYVTANVAVIADVDWMSGIKTIQLVQRNSPPPHGVTRRILGANSRSGVYVAN